MLKPGGALLQVAEKTSDVARSTLVEMHRQGQQLERAELGLHQVGPCCRQLLDGWQAPCAWQRCSLQTHTLAFTP